MSTALPTLLVGSYTATGGGTATGISVVSATPAESAASADVRTVAVIDDPSFLALAGDRVYAVSETADGGVSAFRRDGTELLHLWDAPAGGDAPCHVRVDASGTLVVTNYVSGTVTVLTLTDADEQAPSLVTELLPDASGPDADRQEGPHAHQSIATPDGTVLVADLGGDALHEYRVTDAPSIEPVRVHHVAPGVGPRHMAWYDGDLLVAGELDGNVHRLRRDDAGSFRTVVRATTAPTDDAVDGSLLSHIEVDDRGLVYVAVRGRDQIVVLDAADGGLTLVGAAPSGGVWPRHFARVAGHVLVANQMSDAIAVLPIGADGVPGDAVAQIPVGTPTCIVPL
ncbi:lactonase family protein [Curtobacterium sp. L1-20]|uniref:lactonase family protein n=1 Tax=Curtobacterium sp. L1-20 TaxID=3138181 RepID=UPI003B51B4EC